MKTINNTTGQNELFTLIRQASKTWKEGGLMRVVKFLDAQKEIKKHLGIDSITIDLLKEVKPEYFTMNVKNKKTGIVEQYPRMIFSPYTFLLALRKYYTKK